MSDMLAVLIGVGGKGESQAMLALEGGSGDGRKVHSKAGSEDLFMAVLVERMQGIQGQAGDELPAAVSSGAGDVGAMAEAGTSLPLKPLEIALLQAQQPSVDGAVLVAMGLQLMSPGNPAAGGRPVPGAGTEPGLALAGDMTGKQALSDRLSPADVATTTTSGARKNAAKTAASGQLLPQDRGRGEVSVEVGAKRADLAQVTGPYQPLTVTQGLASQAQALTPDTLLGTSVSPAQGAAGMAHGMGVLGEPLGRAGASVPVNMAIEAPLRSPMFSQELGERIVWLSSRQGQVADIALNPPHLGPLEVKLTLSGGEAGAQFFSPHPQVRDAIEAALPKLRELLAEAGVTLGQAQVRDESFHRQESLAQGGDRRDSGQTLEDGLQVAGGNIQGVPVNRMGLGMVDLYI
ncbi:MAG: flagellar hook-length control protein FliK [Thiobacillus sp.]|nr:flagellar hook-length control protein FliK [Thiobacillus sp.]